MINSFVVIANHPSGTILFNTPTNCVVQLDKTEFEDNQLKNISDETYNYLKSNGFFESDQAILNRIVELRKNDRELLDITISFTQNCNFSCTYCSQLDSKDTDAISYGVLDDIVEYIEYCVCNEGYKRVGINFFGGEPLLQKEKILYFKKQLEYKINSDIISYGIGTNGSLLDEDFLSCFDKLGICIPLTSTQDHNTNRPFYDGSGSYDTILANLIKCNKLFNKNVRLGIRCNIGQNHDNFREFLKILHNSGLLIEYIDVAYTSEFPYTLYRNTMTKKEYSDWYIDECIDSLIDNGFKVRFPRPSFFSCKGYSPHSVKIYSDGRLGSCNGYHYSARKGTIKEAINNPFYVISLFSDIKTSEIVEGKCRKCQYLLLCGGKYFCRNENYCEFCQYNIERFLIKYVDYVRAGLSDQFE